MWLHTSRWSPAQIWSNLARFCSTPARIWPRSAQIRPNLVDTGLDLTDRRFGYAGKVPREISTRRRESRAIHSQPLLEHRPKLGAQDQHRCKKDAADDDDHRDYDDDDDRDVDDDHDDEDDDDDGDDYDAHDDDGRDEDDDGDRDGDDDDADDDDDESDGRDDDEDEGDDDDDGEDDDDDDDDSDDDDDITPTTSRR